MRSHRAGYDSPARLAIFGSKLVAVMPGRVLTSSTQALPSRSMRRSGRAWPFAHRRLRRTATGKVAYRLRRPWFTGQTQIVLEPVAFVRRLAALIPPPRQHELRYHGVFAGRATLRGAVTALVPGAAAASALAGATGSSGHPRHASSAAAPPRLRQPSRLRWSELLRRAFREGPR